MAGRRRQPKDSARVVPKNLAQPAREIMPPPVASLPPDYPAFLEDIKTRIRAAQIKASLSVNRELVQLYWELGRDIVSKQASDGWGTKVIDRLGEDLQREFPKMQGFSRTNVYRMRAFYLAYPATNPIVPQPVGQLNGRSVPQPVGQFLPQPVSEIPWGHNVVLIEKLKDPAQRRWYAQQTIANGWSRSMLLHWIESDLYARQGKAITNFKATLPAPQSDLAHALVKDPYNFDFLTLAADAAERELERGLLDHIRKFLIELGAGFAFVGQQVHMEVDGEDFYLDLLFYHLRLRCFVVIDLKVEAFKPEFAGKINFYLSAVDDQMRHTDDKPSIGLILCKTRQKTIAEYALRDLAKPVGVARYVTKLVESLPANLRDDLPSIQQLQAELDTPTGTIRNPRTVDSPPPKPGKRGRKKKDKGVGDGG